MSSTSKLANQLLWWYYCALLGILILIPQYAEEYSNPFPFASWTPFNLSISPYDILILLGGALSFLTSRDTAVERLMLKWASVFLIVLVIANAVRVFRTEEFRFNGLAEIKCAVELWAIMRIVTWIVSHDYLNLYFIIQVLFTIINNGLQYYRLETGRIDSFNAAFVSLLSLSVMPFCVLTVARGNSLFLRSCCAVAIPSTGFIVLQSISRGNIVIFVVSVLGSCLYILTRRSLIKFGTFASLAVTAALSLIAVLGMYLYFQGTDMGSSYRFWESNQGIFHDADNAAHYDDISGGVSIVLDYPIWGAGINNLPYEYFENRAYAVIHNELLHVWVFYGIFGLIPFVALFYVWPLYGLSRTEGRRQQNVFYFLFFAASYCFVRATVSPPFIFSASGAFVVGACLAFSCCSSRYYGAGSSATHGSRAGVLALQCQPGVSHSGFRSREITSNDDP
jgi:hypothetical protein